LKERCTASCHRVYGRGGTGSERSSAIARRLYRRQWRVSIGSWRCSSGRTHAAGLLPPAAERLSRSPLASVAPGTTRGPIPTLGQRCGRPSSLATGPCGRPERQQRHEANARIVYHRARFIFACVSRVPEIQAGRQQRPCVSTPHEASPGACGPDASLSDLCAINQSAQRPYRAKKAFSEHSLLARPDAPPCSPVASRSTTPAMPSARPHCISPPSAATLSSSSCSSRRAPIRTRSITSARRRAHSRSIAMLTT
jgi:hypothetical protein